MFIPHLSHVTSKWYKKLSKIYAMLLLRTEIENGLLLSPSWLQSHAYYCSIQTKDSHRCSSSPDWTLRPWTYYSASHLNLHIYDSKPLKRQYIQGWTQSFYYNGYFWPILVPVSEINLPVVPATLIIHFINSWWMILDTAALPQSHFCSFPSWWALQPEGSFWMQPYCISPSIKSFQ